MRCHACQQFLSDKEIQASSVEDFINNTVLCFNDDRISKEIAKQKEKNDNK